MSEYLLYTQLFAVLIEKLLGKLSMFSKTNLAFKLPLATSREGYRNKVYANSEIEAIFQQPYEYARAEVKSWIASVSGAQVSYNRTVITLQFTTVNPQTKGGVYLRREGTKKLPR